MLPLKNLSHCWHLAKHFFHNKAGCCLLCHSYPFSLYQLRSIWIHAIWLQSCSVWSRELSSSIAWGSCRVDCFAVATSLRWRLTITWIFYGTIYAFFHFIFNVFLNYFNFTTWLLVCTVARVLRLLCTWPCWLATLAISSTFIIEKIIFVVIDCWPYWLLWPRAQWRNRIGIWHALL